MPVGYVSIEPEIVLRNEKHFKAYPPAWEMLQSKDGGI
jgi:hypothetical protein